MFIDPPPDWPIGIENTPCLNVAYLIDVHLDLQSRLRLSLFFDAVFIAQKDYVLAFQEIGHRHAHWLPHACDTGIHLAPSPSRTIDVGFVGQLGQRGTRRFQILSTVLPKFKSNDYKRYYSPRDMAQVYGQSKIVFNVAINGDLNMRFFEALASGALLVTDRIENGLGELFQEGIHYVGYTTAEEAIEKIQYYLVHNADRERIACHGQQKAFELHTYRHRWLEMLAKSTDAQGQAPARRYSRRALSDLYSDIFVSLRRPSRIPAVMACYGVSHSTLPNLAKGWGRWLNARMPITPNAIRTRLRAR